VSRVFKEAIANFLKHTPCSEGTHSFLHRLLDDADRHIDVIWQEFLDKCQLDSVKERAAFIRCLATVWRCSELAILQALRSKAERNLEKFSTQLEKVIVKAVTNKKATRRDKSVFVAKASEALAKLAKLDFKARWRSPVLDIRSDHGGSRQRTAFMRAASSFFHETTRKWHDDWVADLANIAFPDHEATKTMVISARRNIRSWSLSPGPGLS